MTQHTKNIGDVVLVGAGPGDPGLITVKGLERLRAADVVVFDALANPALLDHAPPAAERIDVGKRAGNHKLTQDQINELLLHHARLGRSVVRLKGGDPYLFGRGAEEVAFLARHGIACEVVPGVTSGIAAPATAGIPVTHRRVASTVTFVTGHEDPAKPGAAVDLAALAALVAAGGTACFYMGVGRLTAIRDRLLTHGLPPETPAALVQWGTLPSQRSVRGTLHTITDDVTRAGLGSPAIIVVGAVAGLDEPGLDFFTARPLFGKTVLITRTRHQASALRQQLERRGAQVLEAPTITLGPAPDPDALDAALRRAAGFDWLIVTSPNGAHALADRLFHLGLDARALGSTAIAAIGDATAVVLRDRLSVVADFVPPRPIAESLAADLIAAHDMKGRRVLLLRADIGRPLLPRTLADAGAHVTDIALYETRPAADLPEHVREALRAGRIDWAAFTSASTARNLIHLLGDDQSLLTRVRIASIGPITSETIRSLGHHVDVEADTPGIASLAAALESHASRS